MAKKLAVNAWCRVHTGSWWLVVVLGHVWAVKHGASVCVTGGGVAGGPFMMRASCFSLIVLNACMHDTNIPSPSSYRQHEPATLRDAVWLHSDSAHLSLLLPHNSASVTTTTDGHGTAATVCFHDDDKTAHIAPRQW
ncbi:hypothetical protein BDN67DRAFT_985107 [Paxillus ammoniavirescens]|nr:hypothetical protein BDN67DRAFT_985107 [Paxillus ammoniavirescens]